MKKRNIRTEIIKYCRKSGRSSFTRAELFGVLGLRTCDRRIFSAAVGSLLADRLLISDGDRLILPAKDKSFVCKITVSHGTFAFAENEDGEEFFIPGSKLNGAVLGDTVKLRPIPGEGERRSCAVDRITSYTDKSFIGEALKINGKLYVVCNETGPDPIPLKSRYAASSGDKILFKIISRKKNRLTAMASGNFGECSRAAEAAELYLSAKDIKASFPENVLKEAKDAAAEPICLSGREDLRGKAIFTIDSEYSKDLDDAVLAEKTDDGYRLYVSIADVSQYVTAGSELDREAYRRGTSIYYADKVIPMLPRELSNGVCSLNPGEDRYCLTCEACLDRTGEIKSYRFYPAVMRSRVKGVYSEVNAILDGSAGKELTYKYREVRENITVLRELYEKLKENRVRRGVVDFSSSDRGFVIDGAGDVTGIYLCERGTGECIIEEMMIVANRCAGMFATKKDIPFVFRVHGKPDPEKLEGLTGLLDMLSIPHGKLDTSSTEEWRKILEFCEGKEEKSVIENRFLRAMAKARYSSENTGHFGLALDIYTHFTSPIRRYPDLAIHRIMKAVAKGCDGENFRFFAADAAKQSSDTEKIAVETERSIGDLYAAEYASRHIGEEASGVISGVTGNGVYVLLENGLEGFIRIFDECEIVKGVSLRVKGKKKEYTVGGKTAIKIVSADVFTGKIDFSFCE